MPAELRLKTRVLPGGKIEVADPGLPENAEVERIVKLPLAGEVPEGFSDVVELINSLTPVPRTPEQWAQVERELREDRDSWDP